MRNKKEEEKYYEGFHEGKRHGVSETEERLKLTWEDIELIDSILKEIRKHAPKRILVRDFYSYALDIFNKETHRE